MPPEPAVAAPPVQLCTFRVGGGDYALDVMRVHEIVNPLPVTPVPRASPLLDGVARLRDEIVPVVDVRRRFGLAPAPAGARTKFLVVKVGARRVALVVDEVCEVLRVDRGAIRPAPPVAAGSGPRFFLGVCGGGGRAGRRGADTGRLRLLVDVRALLGPALPPDGGSADARAAGPRSA
jgi:purine-binding chemotaxis protein CheW